MHLDYLKENLQFEMRQKVIDLIRHRELQQTILRWFL
jgi:hypothetical protein